MSLYVTCTLSPYGHSGSGLWSIGVWWNHFRFCLIGASRPRRFCSDMGWGNVVVFRSHVVLCRHFVCHSG